MGFNHQKQPITYITKPCNKHGDTCQNQTSLGPDFMLGIDRCSVNTG